MTFRGLELVNELIELVWIDPRPKTKRVRLHPELGVARRTPLQSQPVPERVVDDGLEAAAAASHLPLNALGDIGIEGQCRSHQGIMMSTRVDIKMPRDVLAGPKNRTRRTPAGGSEDPPLRTGHRSPRGMVSSMATTKVTITLADEQLDEVRRMVDAGKAGSVSGFVQHAVRMALHDAAGWKEMLEAALQETGGPLTRKERAWADAILSPSR